MAAFTRYQERKQKQRKSNIFLGLIIMKQVQNHQTHEEEQSTSIQEKIWPDGTNVIPLFSQ